MPIRIQHPPRPPRLRAAMVAIALLALAPAGPARSACLPSSVRCMFDTQATTAATYHGFCEDPTFGQSVIDFNVPVHTMGVSETESGVGAELFLDDEFTVNGPPPGTPLNLHLRIRFHGHAESYGNPAGAGRCTIGARALAPVAGDPTPEKVFQAALNAPVSITFADSVDFVVARTAGAPVGIEMHLLVEKGYGDFIDAVFMFLDLPPGSSVTSCKGYAQDQPVPALARSWGSVKASYR